MGRWRQPDLGPGMVVARSATKDGSGANWGGGAFPMGGGASWGWCWWHRLGAVARSLCDEDINTIVTPTAHAAIHTGPITRARARQLNYQVLLFLGNDSNVHENMICLNWIHLSCLQMKGLAWTRKMNLGASSSMEMMACARGSRTELQVMISGL